MRTGRRRRPAGVARSEAASAVARGAAVGPVGGPGREPGTLRGAAGRVAVVGLALVLSGCVTVSVAAPSPAPVSPVATDQGSRPQTTESLPRRTADVRPSPSPTTRPAARMSPTPSVPFPTRPPVAAAATPTPPPQPTTPIPPAPDAPSLPTGRPILPGAQGTAAASPTPLSVDTGTPKPVRTGASGLDTRAERKLQRILRSTVTKGNVAGISVAVKLADGRTWAGVAGNAEFEPVRKIEPDTAFAIASVSKTFVAALILVLAEEGRLSLDEPFGTYFSEATRSRTVTLRQLLGHRSGIYDYFGNPRYIDASTAWLRTGPVAGLGARDRAWSYEDIMSLVKPGYCKPGACYHYSNTNYVILGRVAEAVGGAPLHVQLRQRFFDPLGLDHTLYQPDEPTPLDAAHGHWASGSGHIDHTRDSRVIPFLAALTAADAAGAIASTASDLATWADALFGGRVLSRASLRAMTDFLPPDLYGLGARWGAFADHPAVGHRGGLRGYEASLWYFPGEDVSIALLSNQGNWDTDPVLERVARVVLGRG